MTNNVLSKIVDNKKRELVVRKKIMPLSSIKQNIQQSNRSLIKALSNKKSDFIFECKKASPSKGLLRINYDLDEILASYKMFASAISVLTDNKYFKGSFSHLTHVRQSVSQPVLCKDFFIDEYQVYEARHFGADAILLMLSVLDDSQYRQLEKIAESLNLDILTEVHDQTEMQRAIHLGAKIIGINNRNLKDLSINLDTTENLLSSLPPASIANKSNKTIFISESGINNHQQVKRLAPYVSGFLVGSSIMEKNNITQQCKELIYGTIKICGITNEQTAKTAFKNGAIFGGLIFYPKSPRYINLQKALKIIEAAELNYVGVFVNEKLETLIDIVKKLKLKFIQLHGNESSEYIQELKSALPSCTLWKSTHTNESIENENSNIDRYLFDTYSKELAGGSGQTFDWTLINQENKKNIILAGGLNLANIKEASKLNTYALDINSGVESSPGIKCDKKIENIFEALRT